MPARLQRCVLCYDRRSLYLVFWGAAYLKSKWDIWEGCRSLVTPGGDSGSSPHLKHTESAHTDDGGWRKGGVESRRKVGVGPTRNIGAQPGFKLQKHDMSQNTMCICRETLSEEYIWCSVCDLNPGENGNPTNESSSSRFSRDTRL